MGRKEEDGIEISAMISDDLLNGNIAPDALGGLKESMHGKLCTALLFSVVRKSVAHLPVDAQKIEVRTMLTGFADTDLKEFQDKIKITAEAVGAKADDPITLMMNQVIETTLTKAVQRAVAETVDEMVDEILEIETESSTAAV